MREDTPAATAANCYGSISLGRAMSAAGLIWPGRAHTAATDAKATAARVRAIAAA